MRPLWLYSRKLTHKDARFASTHPADGIKYPEGQKRRRCEQNASFFAQRDERLHAGCPLCRNVASEQRNNGKNG
jgi:hypothetical protein